MWFDVRWSESVMWSLIIGVILIYSPISISAYTEGFQTDDIKAAQSDL